MVVLIVVSGVYVGDLVVVLVQVFGVKFGEQEGFVVQCSGYVVYVGGLFGVCGIVELVQFLVVVVFGVMVQWMVLLEFQCFGVVINDVIDGF